MNRLITALLLTLFGCSFGDDSAPFSDHFDKNNPLNHFNVKYQVSFNNGLTVSLKQAQNEISTKLNIRNDSRVPLSDIELQVLLWAGENKGYSNLIYDYQYQESVIDTLQAIEINLGDNLPLVFDNNSDIFLLGSSASKRAFSGKYAGYFQVLDSTKRLIERGRFFGIVDFNGDLKLYSEAENYPIIIGAILGDSSMIGDKNHDISKDLSSDKFIIPSERGDTLRIANIERNETINLIIEK